MAIHTQINSAVVGTWRGINENLKFSDVMLIFRDDFSFAVYGSLRTNAGKPFVINGKECVTVDEISFVNCNGLYSLIGNGAIEMIGIADILSKIYYRRNDESTTRCHIDEYKKDINKVRTFERVIDNATNKLCIQEEDGIVHFHYFEEIIIEVVD